MNFDTGRQPCDDFRGEYYYGVHSCYCPFEGDIRCEGLVADCRNCHSDHHSDGYETCLGCRLRAEPMMAYPEMEAAQ
jgi:hypothetical protein